MKHSISRKLGISIWIFICFAAMVPCGRLEAVDSAAVKKQFSDPPREYHSAPLWVWNDMLTDEQIVGTLRDLAGQQVRQVFVHPRPGLMTPYLSPEWFRLWKVALEEAERLDMNIWIYDENSYPSGFAGGLVPEAMPESRGKGLSLNEVKTAPSLDDNIVAVFQITGDAYENITENIQKGQTFDDGRYLVASIRLAPTGGWFGGKYYVDLLKPGVTEKFIEVTMEKYRRHIGEHFGKRVPGWFTDEPHLAPAGGLHWSDHLPKLFQDRWGYSLIDHLPQLARPVGDWKRVRHNYYCLLLEQFIDRWAKPCYEYCEKHNLEFTGHYWEHGWPGAGHGGDNMAMYAWHQRPAIDTLMNQYSENVHAQFGNVRAVKELSSVANQFGRKRTLCEAYGAGGWDLRFEDMKRIGDWLYVLGVNTLNEHLSYITIRGARKRDHPQSFSYHEPWWKAYHVMAEYFARLSLIMSQGHQINRILVIEPTTTAWMYQGDSIPKGKLGEIGNQFQEMLLSLERAQVEYDIGCEDIIARQGSTEGPLFKVGQGTYDTVVLTPLTENLSRRTMDLLGAYVRAGGAIICCGQAPSYVDGRLSNHGAEAAKHSGWKQVEPAEVPQTLLAASKDGFAIERDSDDKGILFHHRRTLEDGEFLLLVNTSIDEPSEGLVKSAAGCIEQWDSSTAEISMYPFEKAGAGVKARFELAPCGSLMLFLSKKPNVPVAEPKTTTRIVASQGKLEISSIEDNVLTLDYVDITSGGETKKNIYFYKASQFAFAKNGMGRNPWDSAVQFRDELISRTFGPDSGFEATYRFTIEQQLPKRLWIVIERPDLYSIKCNGKTVLAMEDTWWLDKAFGKIDIANAARVGENTVIITASPFTVYHELEPAYLLGAFTLKETDSGFVVAGGSEPALKLGSWKKQGCPFYAAGVCYKQTFNITRPAGRYLVELDKWYGSVVEIIVNGASAGHIAYKPWQCDVTDLIKQGTNTVEVVVIGTLKNTLGPHHAGKGLGSAWPGMFQQGPETGPPPGKDYHTIDYGLFESFVLKQTIEK
ncbi:MAG: glycosyl hydrolase [Sedimentisphaerales bacterium]